MKSLLKGRALKFVLSIFILGGVFTAYHIVSVQGEGRISPFVLIRLEDVGPGGQYASLEDVGKLRAVIDYLREQHVAYHIGLIPRWVDYPKNAQAYDVSLGDSDNPYVAAFQRVLHEAENSGGVLGLHGYTHQVGNERRPDGHHESGIGNEFNVADTPETLTPAFAETRMKEALDLLNRAGIKPQFWEAPHYHTTAEQDQVFRSYFGLNYQSEVQSHRNAPAALYLTQRNTGYGESTLGAAYVPTPFDYIPYNKDERFILDRLGKSNNVPSFFYHPFLEFKSLVPVVNEHGETVYRDGIPEYRYSASNKTVLQKLVAGLKTRGYAFYTIQDYVPFTPAQHMKLDGNSAAKLILSDADGDGQSDLITWDEGNGSINVGVGRFQGLRNEHQESPIKWGVARYRPGAAAAASGKDALGPCSFWTANPEGTLVRYVSRDHRFEPIHSWKIEARDWDSLYTLQLGGGQVLVAALAKDRRELYGWLVQGDEMKSLKPLKLRRELNQTLQKHLEGEPSLFAIRDGATEGIAFRADTQKLEWTMSREELNLPSETGSILLGDFNGDGREDALRWNGAVKTGTVYLRKEDGEWKLLSDFGPWGESGAENSLTVSDADGNGKSDLFIIDRKNGNLDAALSFIQQ